MNLKSITVHALILFLVSSFLIAQDLKEKIKKIEGEAKEVTITTEDGDVTFSGDEAKEILKMLKAKKHKKLQWISESDIDFDFDSDSDNVFVFKSGDGEKHIIKEFKGADNVMIFGGDDEDIQLIDGAKRIKVEVEDGEKTVTGTTKEDGEEKTETYTGKEADEYLENMEGEHEILIDYEYESDGDHVWIHNKGDAHNIEKEVRVEIEDGVKKVTVKTTKDGEEKVEIYEGDNADE